MVLVSTRRMGFLPLVSPKKRSPAPRMTGKTTSRSSSTRSCSISVYELEAAGDPTSPSWCGLRPRPVPLAYSQDIVWPDRHCARCEPIGISDFDRAGRVFDVDHFSGLVVAEYDPVVGMQLEYRGFVRRGRNDGRSTAPNQLYSWIALTISSSSFETATARLANAARLTPREPSTLLNIS